MSENSKAIDAKLLSVMFAAGAKRLDAQKEIINELNVFPVPDGDTGTNMTMTILSAAKEVESVRQDDMQAVCKAISAGSLRGARGNSGVILSQLFRGFTKAVREYDALDADRLTAGFDKAVETAYKAVMKPKEGTILTVAKGVSHRAQELVSEGVTDLQPFFEEIVSYAEEVLQKTPDMLPVLKEAGVVDSGGQGLLEVLKGALEGYLHQDADYSVASYQTAEAGAKGAYASGRAGEISTADIKYRYCTEFIILLEEAMTKKQEKDFQSFLESVGDSIVLVVVSDDLMCKVHVHSNDPGLVMQRALTYGELSNIKVDNMKMEHRERLFSIQWEDGKVRDYSELNAEISGMAEHEEAKKMSARTERMQPAPGGEKAVKHTAADGSGDGRADGGAAASPEGQGTGSREDASARTEADAAAGAPQNRKETGFVTVCAGDGWKEIFESLGVDHVISGGQTMNPSAGDIIDAVERVNADTVFVMPNNKNIILAAEQAAKMTEESDKQLIVIPTKTIPQGVSAVINFMEGASAEENRAAMTEALQTVKSGEVTIAVRDTTIEGTEIRKDDYMGLGDNGILAVGKSLADTTAAAAEKLIDDETALLSVYYGADVPEADAEALAEKLRGLYGAVDIELQYGGQPVYYYILSAE